MKKIIMKMKNNEKGVEWIDAADHSSVSLRDIKENPTKKYFTKRICYGKIIKEDEFGIVLAVDIDENGDCQITAIPKEWRK